MHTQTKAHEHTEKFRAQLIKKKKRIQATKRDKKKSTLESITFFVCSLLRCRKTLFAHFFSRKVALKVTRVVMHHAHWCVSQKKSKGKKK